MRSELPVDASLLGRQHPERRRRRRDNRRRRDPPEAGRVRARADGDGLAAELRTYSTLCNLFLH